MNLPQHRSACHHRRPFEADFKARLHWSADTDAAIEQRVADILADVQQRGDAAVLEYTAALTPAAVASMQRWSWARPN
jgi:histidinol dehydrogenase